jgi:hypothetical protein
MYCILTKKISAKPPTYSLSLNELHPAHLVLRTSTQSLKQVQHKPLTLLCREELTFIFCPLKAGYLLLNKLLEPTTML